MSDLIERQQAIDYFFRPYSNEEVYTNSDIREALLKLPPAQQWIPCSERLPGKKMIGEKVLLTVDDSVVLAIVPRELNFGRGFWDFEYCNTEAGQEPLFYDTADVSAWRPLPEPYREESNDHQG